VSPSNAQLQQQQAHAGSASTPPVPGAIAAALPPPALKATPAPHLPYPSPHVESAVLPVVSAVVASSSPRGVVGVGGGGGEDAISPRGGNNKLFGVGGHLDLNLSALLASGAGNSSAFSSTRSAGSASASARLAAAGMASGGHKLGHSASTTSVGVGSSNSCSDMEWTQTTASSSHTGSSTARSEDVTHSSFSAAEMLPQQSSPLLDHALAQQQAQQARVLMEQDQGQAMEQR
jgi:hypothetical protein